jgi:hypothetical protein
MIYISHRGLLNGPSEQFENTPAAIDEAIATCFHVEVDLWATDTAIYLGHDKAQHKIEWSWLLNRKNYLWIHCKNMAALEAMYNYGGLYHYFWHQKDTVTLTSRGMIWAYPGKQPIKNSIAVLPETFNDNISQCAGICTDYVLRYRGDL